MAVLGQITVNEISIFEVDDPPSDSPGVAAPIGSIAIMTNGEGVYQKIGASDTAWRRRSFDTSLANIKQHYRVDATNTTTAVTWSNLTTDSSFILPVGLYEFNAVIYHSAAATATGIGLRLGISGGSYSLVQVLWSFMGGGTTNGATAMMWDRLQSTPTDNYVAPNTTTVTANISLARGIVRVSTSGTPVVQFRSEVAGSAVNVLADSTFWFDLIG